MNDFKEGEVTMYLGAHVYFTEGICKCICILSYYHKLLLLLLLVLLLLLLLL